jgi:hypothetical protein
MLTPNEILAHMPAETAQQLFSFLMEGDKPLYKATIDSLAKQRKLRPVFIERKPRLERYAWMKEALGRKQNEGVAAHLLQIWLIGSHKQLLCDFLDLLGIAHDENGTIENLPPAPPKEKLADAVGTLLEKHDPTVVAVYMHAFQALDNEGWSTLEELLHEDARLRLGTNEPAAKA